MVTHAYIPSTWDIKQEDQAFKNILAVYSGRYETLSKTNKFNISVIFYLVLMSRSYGFVLGNTVRTVCSINSHNLLVCFLILGRCWIFSCLNVMRLPFMKKFNIEEFEFSQSYLFFWDKVGY